MPRLLSRTTTALLSAVAALALAGPALAVVSTTGAPAGETGHDISYPQCGTLPATGTFAIVGVNNGLPYSTNPCLAEQSAYAATLPYRPALYVNTANPGSGSPNWPANYASDDPRARPAPCAAGDSSDDGCAYGYGWNAALDALAQAQTAVTAFDPKAVTWWLDVETINSWVGDAQADTAVLQGYADALRRSGVPSVGLYSNAYSWSTITGDFTPAKAASYRAVWASRFRVSHPIELGPVWRAGSTDGTDAAADCTGTTLAGRAPLLTQWVDTAPSPDLDADHQCAAESTDVTPPTAGMTAPTARTSLGTLAAGWTGSDAVGVSSYDVRYRRAAWNGGLGGYVLPIGWSVVTAKTGTLAASPGYTTCFSARARDARANLSGWSGERCTSAPLDDRSLAAGAGWTRATSSAYYRSTYTTTTRAGATLTRSGVRATRLALVATRCPSCGRVEVRLNGALLKTVDLRYSTTLRKAVIALPLFSLRTTTVTLKVISSGATVQVDGLSISPV